MANQRSRAAASGRGVNTRRPSAGKSVKLSHSPPAYGRTKGGPSVSYSLRRVIAGSTREARRVGTQHAARAAAISSTATAAKVSGSVASTP